MIIATVYGFYVEIDKAPEKVYGLPTYRYLVKTPHNNDDYSYTRTEFVNSMRPSILAVKDQVRLILEVLQIVCMGFNDYDTDYFTDYNPDQLKFTKSDTCHTYSYAFDRLQKSNYYLEYGNVLGKLISFEDDDEKLLYIDNT